MRPHSTAAEKTTSRERRTRTRAQGERKDEDRKKGREDAQELAGQGGRPAERVGHLELQRAVLLLAGKGVVAEDEGQQREDDGRDVDEIDGEKGGQERIVAGRRLAGREKRLVPEPDPDPVADLAGDAFAENAQRLGRQDDLRPQPGIDADLGRGLLGGVAVEPVLGRTVLIAADIDQDAEGDEDEAEDEADDEAGRDEVGQEVLLDEGRDHGCCRPFSSAHVVTDESQIAQGEEQDAARGEPGDVEERSRRQDVAERPVGVAEGGRVRDAGIGEASVRSMRPFL